MAQRISFDKITANGNGLGYWHEKALFAPGPLPGEVAWIKVTNEHPKYSEGIVKRLPEKIARRDREAEAHYLTCSPWQNVDYSYQLELKLQMLRETYATSGLTVAPAIIASPNPRNYRNKLSYRIVNTDGKLALTMHERGNDLELIPTPDGCVLGSAAMNQAAVAALSTIDPSLVSSKTNLIVRESRSSGEISLVLAEGTRVVWSNGILELSEHIGTLDIGYPWQAFFQVNSAAFEQALSAITAAIPRGSRVLDLYGGVGTIGLNVAGQALKVIGVELQLEAVEQAEANALINNIHNYESLALLAEHVDTELLAGVDTVIIDPPRAGLDRGLIDQLNLVRPQRVIYLSCNPQTQARDIARLSEGYLAGEVTGFDFYPGTLHLESLVVLERR